MTMQNTVNGGQDNSALNFLYLVVTLMNKCYLSKVTFYTNFFKVPKKHTRRQAFRDRDLLPQRRDIKFANVTTKCRALSAAFGCYPFHPIVNTSI